MTRPTFAYLPLLLGILSGCTNSPISEAFADECSEVQVPAPHAGFHAEYSAAGLADTHTIAAIIDRAAFGENSDDQEILVLPEGSGLLVQTSKTPSPRIGADGALVPAIQVSYVAQQDGHEDAPYADEWISVSDSHLVQAVLRAAEVMDGDIKHTIRFTRTDYPAPLLSSVFWGTILRDGDSGVWPIQFERALPRPPVPDGNLSWQVDVKSEKGDCVAVVSSKVSLIKPKLVQTTHPLLVFKDGIALPWEYVDNELSTSVDFPPLHLKMRTWTDGDGVQMRGLERSTIDRLPRLAVAGDELLAESPAVFDTSLSAALAAANADSTVSAWKSEHPENVVARIIHRDGDPETNVIDMWQFNFVSSNGEGLSARVQNQSPMVELDVLPNQLVVMTSDDDGTYASPATGPRLSINQMAQLHERHFGTQIETLDCSFVTGACGVGTHASTHIPRAGTQGGALSFDGLLIDIMEGLILQDISFDDDVVGAPA